ncbi:MAG: hypothetical protein ABI867_00435 [Kofleriaceae bacterium]
MIRLADLLANPFDDELRLVYADQQQRVGDPRGELAVIQDRLRRDPDSAELRAAEARLRGALLGTLAGSGELPNTEDTQPLALAWHLGFIRRARLQLTNYGREQDAAAELAKLLAHDSAVLLEELQIRVVNWTRHVPVDAFVEQIIAAGPRPAMRSLDLGDFIEFAPNWGGPGHAYVDRDISPVYLGRVGELWPLCPRLEEVRLQGNAPVLGPAIDLPELRVLELCGSSIGKERCDVLARARWPALERLVVWFGDCEYGGDEAADWDDVARLLASLDGGCPRLVHLALANSPCTDEILETMVAHPPIALLRRLRRLDLSLGTLGPDGVRSLLQLRPHLEALEWLNVADGYLDATSVARLRAAWPACRILAGSQDDPAESPRYCTVGE